MCNSLRRGMPTLAILARRQCSHATCPFAWSVNLCFLASGRMALMDCAKEAERHRSYCLPHGIFKRCTMPERDKAATAALWSSQAGEEVPHECNFLLHSLAPMQPQHSKRALQTVNMLRYRRCNAWEDMTLKHTIRFVAAATWTR